MPMPRMKVSGSIVDKSGPSLYTRAVRILVLGAGMMGTAAVYDLARSAGVDEIVVADLDFYKAKRIAELGHGKVRPERLDVQDVEGTKRLMAGCDSVLSSVDYSYNGLLTKCSIAVGVNMCDLGGSNNVVRQQLQLHDQALERGITAIPDCGLAPGIPSILVSLAAHRMEAIEDVSIRGGGLPQDPIPPLNYAIVFSPRGLINEYTEKASILRDGKIKEVDALDGLERITFPGPIGELEAFYTSGGASTLPQTMRERIANLDYKTVRYAGHCELIRAMIQLGMASSESIEVGGVLIRPVDLFSELLSKNLPANGKDLVLLRVTVVGTMKGKACTLVYELTDYYDEKTQLTAMMRTTGFPASIIAQMLASGRIEPKGVVPQELSVPPEEFVEELKKRGIAIRETESVE